MTANVITYRGRSAAREAGKALGFDADTLNRLTKLVSAWEWRDKDDPSSATFTPPASTFSIAASPSTWSSAGGCRTCRAISGSTRAAW